VRINRGFLTLGVFLLLVGAVPLALRAGYLTDDQIRNVGSLWPLILIGVGIGILLARTRVAFLGGILVAATSGVIVGGLFSGGIEGFGFNACGPDGQTIPFEAGDGQLGGPSASIEVNLNCGDVTVSTGPGNTWRVEGEDRTGIGPNLNADDDSLSVRSRDDDRGPFGAFGDRDTWRITLPEAVRLDLDMELNAGSSTVNLGSAAVEAVNLDMNAGSAVLDLGSLRELGDLQIGLNAGSLNLTLPNQSFKGSIEANAGSVNLCAPAGAALRLNTSESIVASYDYEDHGLVQSGSTWQTPGFDSAAVRIELDTQANAGSFSLDPEDGCGG
jgi:hypothetical protein